MDTGHVGEMLVGIGDGVEGGDLEVVLANLSEEKGVHQLKDLLPLPFDARLL